MNQRLDELMRLADPAAAVELPAVTGNHDDPLYLSILEKRGDVMTVHESKTLEPSSPQRRGLLVAAAAFVAVLLVGVALAFFGSGSEESPPVDTSSTTSTTQPVDGAARMDAAASAAIAVATEAGYEASEERWRPQLTFAIGGFTCQVDSDPVQFTELDELTSNQTRVSMALDDSIGSVEVLQFTDPDVAEEAGPILERLLQTRRECLADGLQSRLGSAFGADEFTDIGIEGALGGYLFSSQHDDGSGRVAHIQVAAAIEGDWLYIVTFRSNTDPVDDGLIRELLDAVRGG